MPLPTGCRFAEAEFAFEAPGQKVAPVQAYWLAPLKVESDFTLRPDSPFGMGVYVGRLGDAEMENVARLAGEAGVKWFRADRGVCRDRRLGNRPGPLRR